MKELKIIQQKLEVPKNQWNKFGGFNYRSAEDILQALKPLLKEQDCLLNLTDEIVHLGGEHQDRFYVKAVATITNTDGEKVTANGYARESKIKRGMDSSQITGSASSYARKYALNGLFAIDEGIDADKMDNTQEGSKSTKDKKISMTERKPSSSQISYIKKLGGKVEEGMTMAEASKLIDELNEK